MSAPYCQELSTGLHSDPNFSNTHPCNPFNDHPLQHKEMSARVTLRCTHFPYFPMSNVNVHLFKNGAKVLSLHDVGLYSVSQKVYTQFLQNSKLHLNPINSFVAQLRIVQVVDTVSAFMEMKWSLSCSKESVFHPTPRYLLITNNVQKNR
jgi:hypothetical protein